MNTGGNGLRLVTSQLRVGKANGVLMNTADRIASVCDRLPQVDQLSSDTADDMNAEKLPIVPTKDQLHKPPVLVPVLHAAGRPRTSRPAGECDACWLGSASCPDG